MFEKKHHNRTHVNYSYGTWKFCTKVLLIHSLLKKEKNIISKEIVGN